VSPLRRAEPRHPNPLLEVREAAVTLAIRQNTPAWEAARKATIGSADIAVIVGESPHKSAYTLAAEKLGLIPEIVDEATQELFDIGHLMQPVLLALYERKTGRHPKAAPTWRAHPQFPWATASLDGTAPVRRIVEAKWSHSKRWRAQEGVPGDVNVQVQWQMFVVGWEVADVIVMDFTTPRVETVERDDTLIDNLLFFARDFMGYLERGELPPIDGSESTAATLKARHPRNNGVWLPAQPELEVLANELAEARATKRIAEDTERTVANALRAVIGDADGIDGLVSLKKNRDSVKTNWPAIASAYRTLLDDLSGAAPDAVRAVLEGHAFEDLDTLQSIHTDSSEGARVLRLLSGKEKAA
jgi:putative phage-type endonuclease